jgi:predicted unusual protein kinase regulating ubiquinone biosynthesis (AarF/ABC1/UbiB family)
MPKTRDNTNEIQIMKNITDEIILKKRSRHFALMYKHAICNKSQYIFKNRIICVNELAHGDIRDLIGNDDILKDDELMMNLLFQTFISIGTFHNLLNYVHNDTHSGNFLYQTNNEKGYYEYSFNGKSYYLKSCAYNIMICDFGLAKDVMNKNKIKDDYATISNVFFNKKMEDCYQNTIYPVLM